MSRSETSETPIGSRWRAFVVPPGDVRTHDHDGAAPRHQAEHALEDRRGDQEAARARMAVAHVGGEVLAYAERDGTAAKGRQQGEGDRQRMRAQQPHRVDAIQQPPEAAQRHEERARRLDRVGQRGVVGQRREAGVRGQLVVPRAWCGVEAADERETVEVGGEAGEEARERHLGPQRAIEAAVGVVAVDGESHVRERRERQPNAVPVRSAAAPRDAGGDDPQAGRPGNPVLQIPDPDVVVRAHPWVWANLTSGSAVPKLVNVEPDSMRMPQLPPPVSPTNIP